jgi:arabinofuranosyltransferase
VSRGLRRIAPLLLAPALVLLWAWWLHPATADDAFITYRYARNWAAGLGITYNPGAPPVEGYTNFLWLVLAALSLKLGASPVALMPFIGALCAAGTCLLLGLALRRLTPHAGVGWWMWPGLLVAADPLWSLWAVSGLETPLVALCVTGGMCSALVRRGRAEWTTAAWFIAAALTRPDAALWALVVGLWCLRVDRRRALARLALPLGLAFGGYWVWRWMHFECFWPNSFHAKTGGQGALLILGLRDLGWGLLHNAAVVFPFLATMWSLDVARRRGVGIFPGGLWAAAAAVGVHLLYLAWCGGDAFPGDRFLMPALPVMAIVLFWGTAILGGPRAFFDHLRVPHVARIAVPVILALSALLPLGVTLRARRQTEIAQWRWTCVGRWLDAHTPPGTRVALNPIGAVGFYAPQVFIIDMLGLTDPVIARGPVREPWLPPGHRKGSGERVLALAPDIILINNVWLQPGRMTGWTPLYASEADLHEHRRELRDTYELVNWAVPRGEWPRDFPLQGLPDSVETLWLGALARRGFTPTPGARE